MFAAFSSKKSVVVFLINAKTHLWPRTWTLLFSFTYRSLITAFFLLSFGKASSIFFIWPAERNTILFLPSLFFWQLIFALISSTKQNGVKTIKHKERLPIDVFTMHADEPRNHWNAYICKLLMSLKKPWSCSIGISRFRLVGSPPASTMATITRSCEVLTDGVQFCR